MLASAGGGLDLSILRGDRAVEHDARELPFAIGLLLENPQILQAHLFNSATRLGCPRTGDRRASESPISCRLDLVVIQGVVQLECCVVIAGQAADLFFADD